MNWQLLIGIAVGLGIMWLGMMLWWRYLHLPDLTRILGEAHWQEAEAGLLLVNANGIITRANPAAIHMLGSALEGQIATAVLPTRHADFIVHTLPLHSRLRQEQGELIIFSKRPLAPPESITATAPPLLSQTIPYKVLRAIGELLEPEAVAYIAVQAIADLTNWPMVAIYTPDDEDRLGIRAAVGIPYTDESVIGRAFRTGHTQAVPEPQQAASYIPQLPLPYSALAIPLRRGRKQLGVLLVEHEELEAFNAHNKLIAEALADAIVLALENARFFTEAQNRLTEQTVLREAMSVISSTLDLNTILRDLAEQMGQLMRATSVYICGYDAQQATTTVLAEYYGPRASGAERVSDVGTIYYLPEDFPGTAAALEAGEPTVAYADDPGLSAVKRQHLQSFNGYTSLVIPLQVGGKTIAYAEIWESQQRRTFTPAEIQLCQDIAHHAAVAIENARLFNAVAEERGRLQALIESDRDGIIMVGKDDRILVMNEQARRFLQLDGPLETWLNVPTLQAIAHLSQKSPELAQIAEAERERIIQGDTQPLAGEFDLTPRSIHWHSLPVIEEGETASRLIVLRDITEERVLEKMREDLIHTMVHDLRTPLASISITLDLINMYMGPTKETKVERALLRARTSTEQMLSLVSAILDISRLESDRVELAYNDVTFASIINPVLDLQMPLTLENQLEIIRDVPPDLPLLRVDAALIERVLQNLVSNAIKFTPTGGTVRIKAQANDDHLLVAVSDSGAGVHKSVHGRLFQKFSTGNHPKRGSGLGLAFCKMAIEAHQQHIWLAESSDKGTTFKFTLPLADSNHYDE